MTNFSRRQFVATAAAMGAALAWPTGIARASTRTWIERRDLYPEGVASGDPTSDSVILWTRRPPFGAGASPRLTMEIAEDEQFTRVVATSTVTPKAENDWTVRVLAARLKPATTYWYRFTDAEGLGSRIGRTRTAPAENDERTVSFTFVCCQNINLGYNNAYRRMMYEDARRPEGEQLDFVLHLGDFFYELVWYPEDRATYYARKVRDVVRYPKGQKITNYHIPVELDDYRTVFRAYLADPDLQDARARWPFICMWDNHEFSWRGHQAVTTDDGKVTVGAQVRKVAATQAWFEYQPSRAAKRGDPDFNRYDAPKVVDAEVKTFDADGLGQEPNNLAAIHALRVYRALHFGRNVDLILTDNRSFRARSVGNDDRANAFANDFDFPQHVLEILDAGAAYNGGKPPATISWNDKEIANWRKDEQPKTMLGAVQKQWFLDQLSASKARWKIWGNSVGSLDSRVDYARLPPDLRKGWGGGYGVMTTDDWSGYPYERGQILDHARAHGITGLVSVCGDRHAYFAGVLSKSLPPDAFDPVAIEFITASVSTPATCESLEYNFPMDHPLHALYLRKPAGAPVQSTLNLTVMHGVEASLAFDKRPEDLVAAKAKGNKDNAPHLSFVDWGGHGYTHVRASADDLVAEFVGIPRPVERSATEDGGPLAYRVRHRAKLWSAGERPVLEQTVVEGDAALST